ncbi:GNAT family N-acetyltransferase [Kitasatospora sp. NPDC001660]
MTSFAVSSDFLRGAGSEGLLRTVAGAECVYGAYHDPLTGDLRCLVEHAEPRLLRDLSPLLEVVREEIPGCTAVLARTLPGQDVDPRLRPFLTYLRHTGPIGSGATVHDGTAPRNGAAPGGDVRTDGEVRVTGITDECADRVAEWLARALVDGTTDHGRACAPAAALDTARQTLDDPACRTFVAWLGPVPVGHATVNREASDDPSGVEFVDLLDVLVEPGARHTGAGRRLVRACAELAEAAGLPLVGNVVHPASPAGLVRSEGVVADLRSRGWEPAFAYRCLPVVPVV